MKHTYWLKNFTNFINPNTSIFKKQIKNFSTLKLKAYSLLEIAISLAIIGVLSMAVIKGQQLLYSAKIDKTISQIESIKIAIETFNTTYGALPGDYNQGALPTEKGNGDGIIGEDEKAKFWLHLEAADLITKKQSHPPIGGHFEVTYNPDTLTGHWLLLSGPNKSGLLTPKDAISIKLKIDGNSDNNAGTIRLATGQASAATCMNGDTINNVKQKVCMLYIEFP